MYEFFAKYYSQNDADFIVIVCRLGNRHSNNVLLRSICQKANGVYLIDDTYTYWHLAINICTGINAFLLHTLAPEMTMEKFKEIRLVFPRQSNLVMEILEITSIEKTEDSIIDKFLAIEGNIQRLISAYTVYCLITPRMNIQEKEQVIHLQTELSQLPTHAEIILPFIQIGLKNDVDKMFMVITRKAEAMFD